MRSSRTWTISLPPKMSDWAQQLAAREQRTKSELVREALRCYFTHRLRDEPGGTQARLARVGELATFYRSRHPTPPPHEAELRRAFRGVRRTHERLKRLAP